MLSRLLFSLALVFLSQNALASRSEISDHRVAGLSCTKVTADSVALSMRDDAFSVSNHLPYRNWSFPYGLYDLAGCWSLSRFQRLYFHLREPAAGLKLQEFSDQARSMEMYEEDDTRSWKGFPLKKFWFLPEQTDRRWLSWENGWSEAGWKAQPLARGLKPDIEYYQALRFHQIDNLKYLQGPVARTPTENVTTWAEIDSLLVRGRKPLLLLRPEIKYQHVVVAKRVEQTAQGATVWVYDSNSPWIERPLYWNQATSMFTAYEIVNGMPIGNPHAPLGVFVVDQNENERLLESLATHYRAVCSAP